MPLNSGARVGHYEVVGALGAGGMGEVYRARDTKLGRDVALKVLPESFASDLDRVARFAREAHVLASLSHPNIASIYGLEDAGGIRALVLELVEGPTLSEHIAQASGVGGLAVEEALPIARQIADALEAAHEQGVIHRDLKPANVKVTPNGVVKVLDFGLAKALTDEATAGDPKVSPTLTMTATRLGVILGTAAYMSPEQARGKPVDKRADVWAFGCVLYEMLTGRRAFGGDEVSDTLAFVITKEPDWSALPADTPPSIRKLLRRCLEKDRRKRLADISDARLEIDEAMAEPAGAAILANTPNSLKSANHAKRILPWVVAAVLGAGLAAALVLWAPWQRSAPLSAPVRVSVELGADVSLASNGDAVALSFDGEMLAFVGQKSGSATSQLHIRRLDQLQATPLLGTDGARDPFFSPDGQWIAFFADSKLKKISVSGGAAVTLSDVGLDRGGSWAEDNTIVFQPEVGGGIMRVSSAGGKPEALTKLAEGEITHRFPQVLPGSKAVLFTAHNSGGGFDDANIVVQSFADGTRKVVQRGGYHGRYLPSGLGSPKRAEREGGHLVYINGGTLFAEPFDLDRLEPTGQPVPVLEGVRSNVSGGVAGAALFAASGSGSLVYLPGRGPDYEAPISWVDREGKTTPLWTTAADWSNPSFAPDGRRLAVDIRDGKQLDVWVYELGRDTPTRLTIDAAEDSKPVWTSDGRRIAFASTRGSARNLYWQRADGSGEVQRLTDSTNNQLAASWHPSGKFLAFNEATRTGDALMILAMEGDETSGWRPGKPRVFVGSPFQEREPMFSPDGRWLAYASNESGRFEVYVRPFPGPGGKWQISPGTGGTLTPTPTWSRMRRELFYNTPDNRIMVASYTVEGDSFRADKPRLWSEARVLQRPRQRFFDLHPDGNRIAAVAAAPETQAAIKEDKVVFIFNFFDELRRIAPPTR